MFKKKKEEEKKEEKKIKRKREIRSYIKENKWEISSTIISTTSTIISTIYPVHHHPSHLRV